MKVQRTLAPSAAPINWRDVVYGLVGLLRPRATTHRLEADPDVDDQRRRTPEHGDRVEPLPHLVDAAGAGERGEPFLEDRNRGDIALGMDSADPPRAVVEVEIGDEVAVPRLGRHRPASPPGR